MVAFLLLQHFYFILFYLFFYTRRGLKWNYTDASKVLAQISLKYQKSLFMLFILHKFSIYLVMPQKRNFIYSSQLSSQ